MSGRPVTRWVVEAATTLADVLERVRAETALGEGRVFVDGRRVAVSEALPPGSTVEIYAPRPQTDTVSVLARRDGVAVLYKPAGLPTEPDRRGARSLRHEAAALLGLPERQLHAASRLDVGVSGAVLMALDDSAKAQLAKWRAAGQIERRYVALAQRAPAPERGSWTATLGRPPRVAQTRYTTLAQLGHEVSVPGCARAIRPALLLLSPITGRRHQLRAHAASAGVALLGDGSYGGPRRLGLPDGSIEELGRVALHAVSVAVPGLVVEAPPARELVELWARFGGDPGAWALARAGSER